MLKILDVSALVTYTALSTKIVEVENKIPDVSGIVANTASDTKIVEVRDELFITLNI